MIEHQESWSLVPNYPVYEASTTGLVRRVGSSVPLAQYLNRKTGYRQVALWFNGVSKTFNVHSLVAETFFGRRSRADVTAHKNGNKVDNRLENLMYVPYRVNSMHRRFHMTGMCPLTATPAGCKTRIDSTRRGSLVRGEKHGMSKLTSEMVLKMHEMYASGARTAASVAREMNLPPTTVYGIISGRSWRHLHPDTTLRK